MRILRQMCDGRAGTDILCLDEESSPSWGIIAARPKCHRRLSRDLHVGLGVMVMRVGALNGNKHAWVASCGVVAIPPCWRKMVYIQMGILYPRICRKMFPSCRYITSHLASQPTFSPAFRTIHSFPSLRFALTPGTALSTARLPMAAALPSRRQYEPDVTKPMRSDESGTSGWPPMSAWFGAGSGKGAGLAVSS